MSDTKTCNLTEDELKKLIGWHGSILALEGSDYRIERINYLNKRLKAFKEVEITVGEKQGNSAEAAPAGDWK